MLLAVAVTALTLLLLVGCLLAYRRRSRAAAVVAMPTWFAALGAVIAVGLLIPA